MVAVLAAWAALPGRSSAAIARGRSRRAAALASPRARVAGLAFAIVEGADRAWLLARAGGTPLALPVADGVRVPARTRA